MTWNTILGIVCAIAMFLPVATITYYKLYRQRSLLALGFIYLFTATYNLLSSGYISIPVHALRFLGVFNNYIDVPLILAGLVFFIPEKHKQKPIQIAIISFIIYEITVALLIGFTPQSIVFIMGPGLGIVLFFSFYLFSKQVKITVIYGKNLGRTLMLAAILFAYSCYSIVYLFYYIFKTNNVADAFLIYFITSFVSSCLLSVGLHIVSKRVKQLEELKHTRRELAIFFNT